MAIDIPRLDPIKSPPELLADPDLQVKRIVPEPKVPADKVNAESDRWAKGDRRRKRERRNARVVRRLEMRSGGDRRKGHIIDIRV